MHPIGRLNGRASPFYLSIGGFLGDIFHDDADDQQGERGHSRKIEQRLILARYQRQAEQNLIERQQQERGGESREQAIARPAPEPQEKQRGDAPVLIRIETKSGHGASNTAKQIEGTADIYAFLFQNLGVTPKFGSMAKN